MAALDTALDTHSDTEAAEILNQAGHRLWNGSLYTVRHVYRLRGRANRKGHWERHQSRLRAQRYLTAGELAPHLGISSSRLCELGRQGRILRAEIKTGMRPRSMYKLPPGYDHGNLAAATGSLPASGARAKGGA